MPSYPLSDHFDGQVFFNPGATQAKGLLDVFRWKLKSRSTPWSPAPAAVRPTVPEKSVSGCRVTLVNHSTVLLQYAGTNLLTDPIWSERASPFTWVGPRRMAEPGVRFEDLPPIHVVLLSHNHYDHLDVATLRRLHAAHAPRFVTPLGVAPVLAEIGIRAEAEVDWWQQAGEFTCLPARHFSARGLRDRNRTLWCSWWIPTPTGDVYFAADTGFGSHFAEVRERMGAPRVALVPIGAYKPEWFMGPVHMSPAEAVEAHAILEARESVAIHWGTFALADDGRREPVEDLHRALAQRPGVRPFVALENGGVLEVGNGGVEGGV